MKHPKQFVLTPWIDCEKCGLKFPGPGYLTRHPCNQRNFQHSNLTEEMRPVEEIVSNVEKSQGNGSAPQAVKFLKLTFPVPQK